MRIGFSKDIHIIKNGIPLILGGISIPSEFGLESHSDGDCLIHAIVEAILGALNLGDLGSHYPPTDDKYKGISSTYFLLDAKRLLKENHYKIENIDSFISCEKPKLKKYIPLIQSNIAELLEIDKSIVSIKAGTNEGVGPVARMEAIESYCVVLLKEE